MAADKENDGYLSNGDSCSALNNKESDSSEGVCPVQEDPIGSDRESDSPTPSLFRKFYEAKTKGIYDSRNQDVVAFIVDAMTSDSKKEDRSALMDAYSFLVDSSILDSMSSVTSVNWNCAEANGRRVMHKLCEFFGLNHNIRGATEPNSMTIERKPDKFRAWEFTLTDLATHLQEKQNRQTKTILKRNVDTKASSKTPGGAREGQNHSIASFDERQRNYIAVKQKLGISSDDTPYFSCYMPGRSPIARRNNRQSSPDDILNYRKLGAKNLPNVPPLMGPVYDPSLMPGRPIPHYIINAPVPVPSNQHCLVMRRCSVDQLSPADIHNAYVTRDGRWMEMVSFNGAESVFSPCDEYVSVFLNRKHLNTELNSSTPYPTLSSGDIHGSDGSESFNGSSKVMPSPMLPTGMAAQMLTSVNGTYPPYAPQTFNQAASALTVNGQPPVPIGGSFIGNGPFYHSNVGPSQQPQHPPQSITPQEHHMRPSLSMSQMNQHTAAVPPPADPGAPSLTNGPLVFAPSAQPMTLSDIANRVSTPSGPSTAQAPQSVILGIPSGQPPNPCTGAPPPPVTAQWPVGVNGPPPIFSPAHSQYATQAGPAVGPILRPATVPAGNAAANNFFGSVNPKMQPGVIGPAGNPQAVGFPAVHPGAAHLQSAPHRAYLGQPLMQVSMANNHHGPSTFQRNGRRGPLSRQSSHNGANGHHGGNSGSNNSSVPVSSVH